MTTLTRLAVNFACALVLAPQVLHSQAVSPSGRQSAHTAELAAFLAAQPKWSLSSAVKASYGYKDNLLLSFAQEERSPFVRGGVDFLLLHIPEDRFEFSAFAEAVVTNYTAGKSLKDDTKVWLQADPGVNLGDTLKLSVPVTGFYYDQIFDVSDTEVERLIAELKLAGVMIGPTMRWNFRPAWWFEAQAVGQRKRYEDHANDGDIGEGILRLGWSRGSWLDLQLSGGQRWRDFESRAQYSSPGRELVGTHLKISEREGEFRVGITWDREARWETLTRVSLLHYRDNGSGFFNFREQRVAHELEWTSAPWLVRVGGSASRVDFGVQTVGLGVEPPARLRDEFTGEFHLERKLTAQWMVFGTYLWERSRSNDNVASYTVNEGLLGVRWSWEK